MAPYNPILKVFHNYQEVRFEMERMGVHPRGVELMCPKAIFRVIKLERVSSAVAHILKQEMLAADGEAATNRGAIDNSSAFTDVLLMGTYKTFNRLLYKLDSQPYGLSAVAQEIRNVLNNCDTFSFTLQTARRELVIGPHALVMGVVNVTSDSFYPGNRFPQPVRAAEGALEMIQEGADLIDIGGESTRPGADQVHEEEELRRVIPVIKALVSRVNVPISVDTMKASVASAALQEGAEIVNDISGLSYDPLMAETVARGGAAVVINHIRGTPKDMQAMAKYDSLLSEITFHLREGMAQAISSGIKRDSVIIDPGIGFAKSADHNFQILRHLREFKSLGRPVMVGVSRKSFLSHGGELPPEERLEESLAASVIAALNGASILRTHDVKATKKALWVVHRTSTSSFS